METSIDLPEDLRKLLDARTLRSSGENEYAIDELGHRSRGAMGWHDIIYSLQVEEDEDTVRFEILEQTEDLGSQVVVSTTDSDEVACWIVNAIEEKEA